MLTDRLHRQLGGGGVENLRLSLTSAKVEVDVEAELDNSVFMKTANSSRS